jgi:hypothetical protein
MFDKVMDSFLIQNVKHPTRFRGENNTSILDLIFTNEEGMIYNIEHCATLGNSDHEVLEFNFLYKNVNDVNSYDRLRYFKGDYEAINEVLANVDWELYWQQEVSMTYGIDLPIKYQ